MIQFHWQLETINSRFWLLNILLRKFDISTKKEMKMTKTDFMMKNNNNNKVPKKYIKTLSNVFLWTLLTAPWCNMLHTLDRRRKLVSFCLKLTSRKQPKTQFYFLFIYFILFYLFICFYRCSYTFYYTY